MRRWKIALIGTMRTKRIQNKTLLVLLKLVLVPLLLLLVLLVFLLLFLLLVLVLFFLFFFFFFFFFLFIFFFFFLFLFLFLFFFFFSSPSLHQHYPSQTSPFTYHPYLSPYLSSWPAWAYCPARRSYFSLAPVFSVLLSLLALSSPSTFSLSSRLAPPLLLSSPIVSQGVCPKWLGPTWQHLL